MNGATGPRWELGSAHRPSGAESRGSGRLRQRRRETERRQSSTLSGQGLGRFEAQAGRLFLDHRNPLGVAAIDALAERCDGAGPGK